MVEIRKPMSLVDYPLAGGSVMAANLQRREELLEVQKWKAQEVEIEAE